eukprot:UN30057
MRVFWTYDKYGLPHKEISIAELVKPEGYATGMAGKWHLGINKYNRTDGHWLPNNQGFDNVGPLLPFSNHFTCDEKHKVNKPDDEIRAACFLYYGTGIVQQPIRHDNLTKWITDYNINFIKESHANNQPFFLYMSFAHLHSALFTAPEFEGVSRRGPYGDNVMEMQSAVGRVMETLKEIGIDKNTLSFFLSDNGGHVELCSEGGDNGMFRGGKGNAYEGGFRSPAVVHWPGKIKAGSEYREVVNTMDIFPTIADLLNIEMPKKVYDGQSILPVLLGEQEN